MAYKAQALRRGMPQPRNDMRIGYSAAANHAVSSLLVHALAAVEKRSFQHNIMQPTNNQLYPQINFPEAFL